MIPKRLILLCGLAAQLAGCGYGWPRDSNQYPPSDGNRMLVVGNASGAPASAAGGSVAYPSGEATMQGSALPPRAPLGRPTEIPAGAAATPAAPAVPVAPVVNSPEPASSGRYGVGYSALAPSEVPIIAPEAKLGASVTAPAPAPVSPPVPASVPAPVVAKPALAAVASAAPVVAAPVAGSTWNWPVQGTVVKNYAPGAGSKGVDISVDLGTPVKAAAAGRVAYSGTALKGYGELIVIKHDEVYLSAYGYNRKRLVKEGEQVKAGQVIAESGIGPEQNTVLHFEIRENGNPVNPLPFLPQQ